MNSFINRFREITDSLIDGNGNERLVVIGYLASEGLDEDRIKLLKRIVFLVRDSNIVNIETKMYVMNRVTKDDVFDKLRKLGFGDSLNRNTVHAKIGYGVKGLDKNLSWILKGIINRSMGIKEIEKAIIKLVNKYNGEFNIGDMLVIKISDDILCKEITDDEFNVLRNILKTYSKNYIDNLIKNNERLIGYFNYLKSGMSMNSRDKERLLELEAELKDDM